MIKKIGAYIRENGLIGEGERVLVGLSGGADSVALLRALVLLAPEMGFSVAAAHLNHGIRGAAADADEAFAKALAEGLSVPFIYERANVPTLAKAHLHTLEQEARIVRYDFLRRAKERLGASAIAVAHHMDDQAESVLMHLARGSGLMGLTGMQPRRGDIIRPMLSVRRREIEAYLNENGFPFCTDETNLVPDGTRNRFRLAVIPYLEKNINPAIVPSLCSMAELLLRDEEYISSAAIAALDGAKQGDGYNRAALASLPLPLKSRAIRIALSRAGAEVDIERNHVEKVSELLTMRTGARLDLPGAAVWASYDRVFFGKYPELGGDYEFPLAIPGETETPRGAFTSELTEDASVSDDPFTAYMDMDALPSPLTVRPRKNGDRFRPLGAPGERKLKEFFIDKKLPRDERDIPLIASGQAILFVPGQTIADTVKVKEGTKRVLRVKYTPKI